MRQLGDLLVWCAVLAVVAGVIYLSPMLSRQDANAGSMTFAPHTHGANCSTCLHTPAIQNTP
jgi:hypothetical protein